MSRSSRRSRSDVEVLLNASLLAVAVAVAVLVDRLVHPSLQAAWAPVALILSYAFYRLAVRAEMRLGHEKRASVDLHRLELYERLGLRAPTSFTEARELLGPALSQHMQWGTPLPDELCRGEYPSER